MGKINNEPQEISMPKKKTPLEFKNLFNKGIKNDINYFFENSLTKETIPYNVIKEEEAGIALEGKGCGDTIFFRGSVWIKRTDNMLGEFLRLLTKSKNTKEEIVNNYLVKVGFLNRSDDKDSIFEQNDIKQIYKNNKFSKDVLSKIENPSNEAFFISQPFGSQDSPDLMIFYYGWLFLIELKSAKNGCVALNSHLPRMHPNFLYAFSSVNDGV
jgi:hypothetical protein